MNRNRVANILFMAVGCVVAAVFSGVGAFAQETATGTAKPKQVIDVSREGKVGEAEKQKSKPQVDIYGYRTMKWRGFSSTGSRSRFYSDNGLQYLNSEFEQSTHLNLTANYQNEYMVQGEFVEVPYQDRTMLITIDGNGLNGKFGDFSTVFPGGPLTTFSKSVRGVDFVYSNSPSLRFRAITTKQKSQTKKESFVGRNLRGPYKLGSMSIIEGSEVVRINGAAVSASEYSMDYFTGELTFDYSVDPTQVIEVNYESELLMESKTGALVGFGVEHTAKSGKYSVGVSYVSEGTNRFAQSILEQDDKAFTVAAVGVPVSLGRAMLEKNTEIATASGTNLVRTQYSMDYVNGKATILDPALIGKNITVYFSYYNPKYIREVNDEELRGMNSDEYVLSKGTVYSGVEVVQYYEGTAKIGAPLVSGTDYIVFEERNSIKILQTKYIPNTSQDRYLKISYRYVQKNAAEKSNANRDVLDVSMKFAPVKNMNVEAELSRTKADQLMKTIQVIDERVATVASATQKIYTLAKNNVIAGSEEIYFDDLLTNASRQSANSDYTLYVNNASDTVELHFLRSVPVGTTIIANYKYRPTIVGGDVRTGTAQRVAVNYAVGRVRFGGETINKNAFFSPLNAYNDLKTTQSAARIDVDVMKNLTLFTAVKNYDAQHDLNTSKKDRIRETSAGITYRNNVLKELTYSRVMYKAQDTLATHKLNYDKDADQLYLNLALMPKNKLSFDTKFERTDLNDKTGTISDREMRKSHYGITYRPVRRMTLNSYMETNRVDFDAPAGFGAGASFRSRTFARAVNMSYVAGKIWTFTSDTLLQKRTDSRPSVKNEAVDTVRLALVAAPFGRFTNVNFSFNRSDTPDIFIGGTRSDFLAFNLGYKIARKWVAEPSFNRSVSSVGTRSRNSSRTEGVNFVFNPQRFGKWSATIRFQDGSATSRSTTTTTTKDKQYVVAANYFPTERFEMMTKFDMRNSGGADTSIISNEMKYRISSRGSARFNFSRENRKQSRTAGYTRDQIIVEGKYIINKTFSVMLNNELQRVNTHSIDSYRGRISTLELRADF